MVHRESESMICDEATHCVLMVGEVAHLMAARDPVKRKEKIKATRRPAFEDPSLTPYVLTSPCLIIVILLCNPEKLRTKHSPHRPWKDTPRPHFRNAY